MRYVIIGGGPAGTTAALEIRKRDKKGEITLISNEDYQFYKRSKILNFISASCTEDDLFTKGKKLYDENNIKFIYDPVESVFPEKKQLILKSSAIVHYDYLLIASGGNPIILPWKGVELEGIHTLYNLNDAKKVAEQACNAKKVVIVGGGAIAMKAIQNFKKIGMDISIIELSSHLWPIGFDRKVARIVEKQIKENGIHIYLEEEVVEFKGKNGKLSTVVLKSGKELQTDLVVITIGMKPNVNFLKNSDVKIDKGILVDSYMRTNVPNIYAAGDVAQIYDPLYNQPILHPTWGNAKRQGKIAARNMVGKFVKYKGTIPIQSIKIFGFTAIAVGITHSKKNFDEISWISFNKKLSRKFIFKNDQLLGALILGKQINKKILKPILKKLIFSKANLNEYKHLLLMEDIEFNNIIKSIEISA
ncbi:MAG: NAD(P)/FAD-dependent oxidoreductase [Candidatus Thorarchaeota archaeon]